MMFDGLTSRWMMFSGSPVGQRVRVAEPQRPLVGDVGRDGDGHLPLPLPQRPQHRQQVAPAQQLHR
jgi:hypothetical protein